MHDPTSRAISTVGIWIAVSIILTFGVFRAQWNDFIAVMAMLIIVVAICAAAAYGTAAIWRDSTKRKPASSPVSSPQPV